MKLDDRLEADCKLIYDLEQSILLLMNNALVNWFILVPRTEEIELTNLPVDQQTAILKEINFVSHFIQQTFSPDKLNIATLGNVVSQLHIHVIGRKFSDPYWPAPVWGQTQTQAYCDAEVKDIVQKFDDYIYRRMS